MSLAHLISYVLINLTRVASDACLDESFSLVRVRVTKGMIRSGHTLKFIGCVIRAGMCGLYHLRLSINYYRLTLDSTI